MRNFFKYMLMASAALAGALACTRTVPEEGNPTDESLLPISVSVSEASQTKALIDPANFGTDGNRIHVLDFWTDGNSTVKYIDNLAGPDAESSSSQHVIGTTWPFVQIVDGNEVEQKYNWTATGTHKFFGWYAKDAVEAVSAEEFFSNGFSFSDDTKVLSVPATALTDANRQFDFLYSNICSVDVSKGIPAKGHVPLTFSHLFTAISFGAKVVTASDVKLLEFRVENIKNSKSATIDFSGDEPSVSYTDNAAAPVLRSVTHAGGMQLPAQLNNIFGPVEAAQQFILMWPQAAEDLHSTQKVVEDSEGNVTYPSDYKMYIKYTLDDGEPLEKRLNFSDQAWEAGKKYHYWVIFTDKMLELKCVVNPWQHVEQEIDFNENVLVKDEGQIRWDESKSTVDKDKKLVIIKDGQPAEATFTFDAPEGGQWIASLHGDVDAFSFVDASSGPINGTSATVKVAPAVRQPSREYKAELHFIVRRADGTTLAADNLVQPEIKKYTIVLQKNN